MVCDEESFTFFLFVRGNASILAQLLDSSFYPNSPFVGDYIYKKASGYTTLLPNATPIDFHNTFVMASCTKLITTIAALQCVERGLITLDEPLDPHLPELAKQEIIEFDETTGTFSCKARRESITLRQLLTHSSGIGYDHGEPALEAWRESRGEKPLCLTARVVDAFGTPLLFEPGTGWKYGGGIDWAGLLVQRLNGNTSLEAYYIENIFAPLKLESTTLHLHLKPHLVPLFVGPSYRAPDGNLIPGLLPYPWPPGDEYGGNGLYSSVPDYIAVLGDIIKDEPVLLKKESADIMFSPQLPPDSDALKHLYKEQHLFENSAGGHIGDLGINYGLGALLFTEHVPLNGAPPNTLAWGGLPNLLWWANREQGVAGMYATQVIPHADGRNTKLAATFQKAIWESRKK